MYVVFLLSCICILFWQVDMVQSNQLSFFGLFLAASAGFGMGLADDAYDTKPYLKLFVQILCGCIFAFTNNQLKLTHIELINVIATIIWVVSLMNSLNMLDNMDGITGTTSIWVLVSCLIIHILNVGWVLDITTILNLTCIGTFIGFLYFNVNPSKMFMGDGGSQFVGVVVSYFTIHDLFGFTFDSQPVNFIGLALALTALTPAAADTLTVVINRLKRGQSPMVGGKDHTTHHLVYAGNNDFQVWLIFLAIGALSTIVSISVYFLSEISLMNAVLLALGFYTLVFWRLYRNTILFKAPK